MDRSRWRCQIGQICLESPRPPKVLYLNVSNPLIRRRILAVKSCTTRATSNYVVRRDTARTHQSHKLFWTRVDGADKGSPVRPQSEIQLLITGKSESDPQPVGVLAVAHVSGERTALFCLLLTVFETLRTQRTRLPRVHVHYDIRTTIEFVYHDRNIRKNHVCLV